MKLIGPPGTELRHILAVHIMCSCDLDLWPIFLEIGSCDPEVVVNISAYLEVYRRFPWQPYCLSLVGGSSSCEAPSIKLIGLPVSELLQFLIWYVTWRCNLDLWPFDPGILSRDATLVVNTGAKFELNKTYRSRVRTTTIVGERSVKIQIASF